MKTARLTLVLASAFALLLPTQALAHHGGHGEGGDGQDSCPKTCKYHDDQCRGDCSKGEQDTRLCQQACDAERDNCPDLCHALMALATDSHNPQKIKRLEDAKKKRRESLEKIWEKQDEWEERTQREKGEKAAAARDRAAAERRKAQDQGN